MLDFLDIWLVKIFNLDCNTILYATDNYEQFRRHDLSLGWVKHGFCIHQDV